jgi:ABC-2 type transport system ATP-binding protein
MLALVRRIGTEFGIPVLITSHLLGELEHVCDHIVVLDGGRLLRSESKAALTGETGVLAVEVRDLSGRDRLGAALTRSGARARPDGPLVLVEITGDETYDLVRDTVAELGLGLVRVEPHRHRLEEVFSV